MIPNLTAAAILGIAGLFNISLEIREKNYAIKMVGVLFTLHSIVWLNFAILYGAIS